MERLKVKDNPTLVRDTNNRAILNTESKGLMEYRQQREARLRDKDEKEQMKLEQEHIKKQISDIDNKLNLILSRLS